MKPQQAGYTLIELLIVLSILSILLLLPTPNLQHSNSNSYQADLVAKQIRENIILAQQVAISTGRITYFRLAGNESVIRFSTTDIYLTHSYAVEELSFEPGSFGIPTISYNPNGHPVRSGTFFIDIDGHRYRYIIYLGKGMVSYEKM